MGSDALGLEWIAAAEHSEDDMMRRWASGDMAIARTGEGNHAYPTDTDTGDNGVGTGAGGRAQSKGKDKNKDKDKDKDKDKGKGKGDPKTGGNGSNQSEGINSGPVDLLRRALAVLGDGNGDGSAWAAARSDEWMRVLQARGAMHRIAVPFAPNMSGPDSLSMVLAGGRVAGVDVGLDLPGSASEGNSEERRPVNGAAWAIGSVGVSGCSPDEAAAIVSAHEAAHGRNVVMRRLDGAVRAALRALARADPAAVHALQPVW